ncbi:MAG TPA: hypothetical protein VGQ91_04135 [Ideonella sp.]|jgi:hypothetical protein|nr:hypothetical protein [Ideonella sp.]
MTAADAMLASAAPAAEKAALVVDVWVDLFATSLARNGALGNGLPVVLTDTLRVLPLLESQGPVGWIHTSPWHYQDYVVVAQGQPAPRPRIDAAQAAAEASRLLRRAALCLAAVPAERASAQAMAALAAKALQARAPLLLFGAPQAGGWPAFDGLIRQGGLQPVEAGGARVLASAGLAGAMGDAGLHDVQRAVTLTAQLARARQADLLLEPLGDGHLRLRLRIDPVLLVAAGAGTLAHHIAHEGRALFNSRGLGALLLPWGAPCQARLLLRNVRARIDGSEIAIGRHALAPTSVDYTEHGAFLRLALPAITPGRDALLHLSLPREAVPGDGFCDIGAAEFTVETA